MRHPAPALFQSICGSVGVDPATSRPPVAQIERLCDTFLPLGEAIHRAARVARHVNFLVLSPHRDDAAFSCGVLLHRLAQTSAHTLVVNFFTRSVYAPFSDVQGVEAVTRLRCMEDERVAALLGPSVQWLDLAMLDAPLRLGIDADRVLGDADARYSLATETSTVKIALSRLLHSQGMLDVDGVFVPSAIGGHVDHRLVRAAAEELFCPVSLAYYEDLPYAARCPDRKTLVRAQERAFSMMLLKAADALRIKYAMSAVYSSQIEMATAEEIAKYTGLCGGERFLMGKHARASLKSVL